VQHIEDETLFDFICGQLDGEARRAVVDHAAACTQCARLIAKAVDAHVETQEADAVTGDLAMRAPGTTLGRYVLLDRLGEGGMGVVYAAHDPELDRKVALKLLRTSDSAPKRRERLLREAKALARLAHPNVVAVHDVGSIGEQVFVAMELIDGRTLRQWVADERPGWRAIVEVYRQAGRALSAAHALGIVHRDFKPDNVLIDSGGRVRVVDFGLARAVGEQARAVSDARSGPSDRLTRTGSLMGTPAYMAPEQHRGEAAGAAADQFGFCVALYEALYGQRPFAGDTLDTLARSVTAGDIRAPSRDASAPLWLHRVLARGLRVAAIDRYPTMDALLAALDRDPAPRRRRVALAIALTLAIALVASGLVHQRHTASVERQRAAARLGHAQALAIDVERLRSGLRAARLLPPHDTTPERDALAARLREVEAALLTLGSDGAALCHSALGVGYVALDEHERARPHLEAAWRLGEHSSDLAFALGVDLGELYHQRERRLIAIADRDERARTRVAVEHELRDPALVYLRDAKGAANTQPAYVEGLIAFQMDRFTEAAELAHAAFTQAPLLFEAGELEARALFSQARERWQHNDVVESDRLIARAREAFARVRTVARSYSTAEEGKVLVELALRNVHLGKPLGSLLDDAEADCRLAIAVDPQGPGKRILAVVYWVHGEQLFANGGDPSAAMARAIALAEEDARAHPSSELAFDVIGNASGTEAWWQSQHHVDHRAALSKSIEALRAEVAILAHPEALSNLCAAILTRSSYEIDHGVDASESLGSAADACQAALARQQRADALLNLAAAYNLQATVELRHDRDPAALVAKVDQAVADARKLDIAYGALFARPTLAHTLQAQYELQHGRDPRPELARALAECALWIKTEGNAGSFSASARARLVEARYDLEQHRQPASLARARADARKAVALDASNGEAHARLAEAELVVGRAALYAGRDPSAAFAAAAREVAASLAASPGDVEVLALADELRRWSHRP
jgi:predicted Ser/Thr protein kinase